MGVEGPSSPKNSIEFNVPIINVNEALEIEEVKSIKHTKLKGSFQLLKLPSNKRSCRYSN